MIFLLHDVYLLAKLIIIFLEIFFVNDFPQFDAAAREIILKKKTLKPIINVMIMHYQGYMATALQQVASKATLEVICVPRMCIRCLKCVQQFESCPIIAVAAFTYD